MISKNEICIYHMDANERLIRFVVNSFAVHRRDISVKMVYDSEIVDGKAFTNETKKYLFTFLQCLDSSTIAENLFLVILALFPNATPQEVNTLIISRFNPNCRDGDGRKVETTFLEFLDVYTSTFLKFIYKEPYATSLRYDEYDLIENYGSNVLKDINFDFNKFTALAYKIFDTYNISDKVKFQKVLTDSIFSDYIDLFEGGHYFIKPTKSNMYSICKNEILTNVFCHNDQLSLISFKNSLSLVSYKEVFDLVVNKEVITNSKFKRSNYDTSLIGNAICRTLKFTICLNDYTYARFGSLANTLGITNIGIEFGLGFNEDNITTVEYDGFKSKPKWKRCNILSNTFADNGSGKDIRTINVPNIVNMFRNLIKPNFIEQIEYFLKK